MISKLVLSNFRNYQSKTLQFNSEIVAIYGDNGIGKTNILEAISLFNKGKGLRSANLEDMVNNSGHLGFTIYSELLNHDEISSCATSFDKITGKRIFQVNGNKSSSIRNFPAIIWLTPKMDTIFTDSKSVRRKFIDKIVANFDHNHGGRINDYDKCLKERMLLLEQNKDEKWLAIIERKIAELGVAIAIARNEIIEHLNKAILLSKSDFIKTRIEIIGAIEDLMNEDLVKVKKSLEIEEFFIAELKNHRKIDAQAKRSLFGVHRSDFGATLLEKNITVNLCSTGEQKSVLIAIILAAIRVNSFFGLPKAILLLDEIVSHLDENKRRGLLQELQNINSQSFLTGTNKNIFSDLNNLTTKSVEFLEISK